MGNRVAIISGCDEAYSSMTFDLMLRLAAFDYGDWEVSFLVQSYGMKSKTISDFEDLGVSVPDNVLPYMDYSAHIRCDMLRPLLPMLYPGYDIYVWIDGDMSVQSAKPLIRYIKAAQERGFAVAREENEFYRRSWKVKRWHYGNCFRLFSLPRALRMVFSTKVNTGIVAGSAYCPLWEMWHDQCVAALARRKGAYNQHALISACLDWVPAYLDETLNWTVSNCRPHKDGSNWTTPRGAVIEVLHWATTDKDDRKEIKRYAY